MASVITSAIGVDIGRYALKSVLLQRRGADRYSITHCASRPLPPGVDSAEALGTEIKALLKDMGGSAKSCAVSISSKDALYRVIEQPETPPEVLRDALKLNSSVIMNQDCRDYVLDCAQVEGEPVAPAANGLPAQLRYFVAGLPRAQVGFLSEAMEKVGRHVGALSLGPVCLFNAFEMAQPEAFSNQSFLLLDIGHQFSTIIVGARRQLFLVRLVDVGASFFIENISSLTGESPDAILKALSSGDEVMIENSRMSVSSLSREIAGSIGFYEGQFDDPIRKIYVSGGILRGKSLVDVMSEEFGLPCEAWHASDRCEHATSGAKKQQFDSVAQDLNVACGAAMQLLKVS